MKPHARPQRLRRHAAARDLIRETRLDPQDLILPLFVEEGLSGERPIPAMPGHARFGLDAFPRKLHEAAEAGVKGVLLFGVPQKKDPEARSGRARESVVCRALEVARKEVPDLLRVTDVCICAYTDTGHCGLIDAAGGIDVDRTLPILADMAVAHARAGADWVAPSAMMDGQVAAIRAGLDEAGFGMTAILAYASKFASAFYGPFREAADSAPVKGPKDRQSYQLDPANAREALLEARLDDAEGADVLMVKPALPYLDIIARVRAATERPVAAYHVSGEYSMVHAAARNGWLDLDRAMREMLLAIKRAGADIIITYAAVEAARALREGRW